MDFRYGLRCFCMAFWVLYVFSGLRMVFGFCMVSRFRVLGLGCCRDYNVGPKGFK